MESIYIEKEIKSQYPKLMIDEIDTTKIVIVLFTDLVTGTVLYSNDNTNPIGYTSCTWISTRFRDFTGELTLKN